MKWMATFPLILFSALINCTGQKPEPIEFHHDSCHYCKMVIVDKRFGAEIMTSKGKIYKFDSLECMHNYEKSEKEKLGTNLKEFVVNTSQAGELIAVGDAYFYVDPVIRSPMGRGFFTAQSEEKLRNLVGKNKQFIRWIELQEKYLNPGDK